MEEFEITERTEPFTLDEVFSFIDDTNISKMDAHELKSRIEDAVKGIRAKAIDEFVERARILCINRPIGCDCRENIPLYAHTDGTWHDLIADIAEAMKGGVE